MKPLTPLRNASFLLAAGSLGLVVWSQVVWNRWGYDAPLWKGVVEMAAAAGWYLGWTLFVISAGAGLMLMLLRNRRNNS